MIEFNCVRCRESGENPLLSRNCDGGARTLKSLGKTWEGLRGKFCAITPEPGNLPDTKSPSAFAERIGGV